jgi:hypothetical protein
VTRKNCAELADEPGTPELPDKSEATDASGGISLSYSGHRGTRAPAFDS